jgi:hypothetical protein
MEYWMFLSKCKIFPKIKKSQELVTFDTLVGFESSNCGDIR